VTYARVVYFTLRHVIAVRCAVRYGTTDIGHARRQNCDLRRSSASTNLYSCLFPCRFFYPRPRSTGLFFLMKHGVRTCRIVKKSYTWWPSSTWSATDFGSKRSKVKVTRLDNVWVPLYSVTKSYRHSLDGATTCCWPRGLILIRRWCYLLTYYTLLRMVEDTSVSERMSIFV